MNIYETSGVYLLFTTFLFTTFTFLFTTIRNRNNTIGKAAYLITPQNSGVPQHAPNQFVLLIPMS